MIKKITVGIISFCLANVCQAGTYARFNFENQPLPYCTFEYLEWVDKDRQTDIYNPIYINQPVQLTVTSPTYFGWSWLGLTPLTNLQIGSHKGKINPVKLSEKTYQFTLTPLEKAGEFYYFTGKLTKSINGLNVCVKAAQ